MSKLFSGVIGLVIIFVVLIIGENILDSSGLISVKTN